jgi:hypothetical protein
MRCVAAVVSTCCAMTQGNVILQDFNRRIADYRKLHQTVESQIHRMKPTKSPEAIEHYEHSLAHGIRQARRGARQGDIFSPEIAAEFRRLVGVTMHGADATAIRKSLQHAEPVAPRDIRVNGPYPPATPLQSTPSSLLLNLPPLPPDLEYRVVGHRLILRDVDANLIVDFIDNAIP